MSAVGAPSQAPAALTPSCSTQQSELQRAVTAIDPQADVVGITNVASSDQIDLTGFDMELAGYVVISRYRARLAWAPPLRNAAVFQNGLLEWGSTQFTFCRDEIIIHTRNLRQHFATFELSQFMANLEASLGKRVVSSVVWQTQDVSIFTSESGNLDRVRHVLCQMLTALFCQALL